MTMANKKANDGSRFIKVVIPEHVANLEAWCERTGLSAPKAIDKAIKMAMAYETEMPEKVEWIRTLETAIKHKSFFFSGIVGGDTNGTEANGIEQK
jgi:hypothetical protein